ncbi:MAG: hypothetical protein DHS20C19_04120 [Acidimicrobiales bacterium]|nr:MAG: hypothetical protein DHS20C19_04120 [Acidimicrobiales bacterium]
MEWVESTGSTIEEAKERALDRLGVHTDDAEFEVIGDVKTGLFGRVKEEARVRARVAPATPRAKDERRRGKSRSGRDGGRNGGGGNRGGNRGGGNRSRGGQNRGRDNNQQGSTGRASGAENGKNDSRRPDRSDTRTDASNDKSNRGARADNRKSRDTAMSDDEPTMPLTEQADLAEAFVTGLAERFGTDVSFAREDVDDDEIRITVSGEDLGRLVGHRGTTAGAIDELVRTVLQRQAGSSRNGRIRVDVGGVRARRAEALANFARAQAAEVRESGNARSLEPMSPADRKVVHDALTDEEGVDTTSEGEDNQRRVVIIPA